MRQFCHETSGWDTLGLITLWRIDPTPENYYKLPMCMRPTDLQLSRPHWPIIDWMTFPRMRDAVLRNVELYDLTELCADMNCSYCFEMDLEEIPSKPVATTTNASTNDQGFRSATVNSNPGQSRPGRNPEQNVDRQDRQDQRQYLWSSAQPENNQDETLIREFVKDAEVAKSPTSDLKQAWVRLLEYVEHRKDPTVATSQGRVLNKSIIARLMLAFHEFENPFKLHPGFFQRYPGLYADDYVAKGQEISIFL